MAHLYYHKYNSLWRQFDSLVDLPSCTCNSASKLKDHKDLMRVESHKNSLVHSSSTRRSSSVFISRSNIWSNNKNNQNKGLGRNNNLVCKHCHRTEHTIDKCFELNGYPLGFKKKNLGSSNVSYNASSSSVKPDQSAWSPLPFTFDRIQRLMALIGSNPKHVYALIHHPLLSVILRMLFKSLKDDKNNYEGEDYVEFNMLFEPDHSSLPESSTLRRSRRKIPESPWGSSIPIGDGDGDVNRFPNGDGDGDEDEAEKRGWGWVEAMNQEMEALNRNKTWEITDLPKDRKAIGLEDVYMQLADGYFTERDENVCKLTKSLYGLKQAPRNWNEK
ncbi:ribonuclease H-like domain-containing protein [Tanacetum coccineum]